jgi:hypothetical protein
MFNLRFHSEVIFSSHVVECSCVDTPESYQICFTPEEYIGGAVRLKNPVDNLCYHVYFEGKFGNPIVKFDNQHLQFADLSVSIDSSRYQPAMTKIYPGTQVIQLSSDLTDPNCVDDPQGTAESVAIGSAGGSYWIHTTSFHLLENTLKSPLKDGGKQAVDNAINAPADRMVTRCASAPRTFLNEVSCVLSQNACSFSDRSGNSASVVVCGSPYETSTKHKLSSGTLHRGGFDLATQFNRTTPTFRLQEQRETVWFEIALNSKDQLRQRIAWALYQILAISPNFLSIEEHVECYLAYYDIFVRHSFGNYFDILKEVTYSPMMAEMLTFVGGQSTGYVWTNSARLQYADENYAREILQLFTLGLHVLNEDGSLKTDQNGREIRTYGNEHISEYARVFVGFVRQLDRGNIEDRTNVDDASNRIDPMSINAEYKDHFPKVSDRHCCLLFLNIFGSSHSPMFL